MTEITKKNKRNVPVGIVSVKVTTNNTFVTFTDPHGNVIATSSAGANNFKGAKKATPYAAHLTATNAANIAKECGMKTVYIKIAGIGHQREAVLRALQDQGLTVTSIIDNTPIPHNGTRPRKTRRV